MKYKQLIIDAFASGKFKKGFHRLKTVKNKSSYYCAEGVLCELYRRETGRGKWKVSNIIPNSRCFVVEDLKIETDVFVPGAVLEHFEIPLTIKFKLISWNDTKKLSFKKIAAKIEELWV